MNLSRFSRLALVALIPTAALSLGLGMGGLDGALAQSPAAPPAASTPATPAPSPTPTSPGLTSPGPATASPTTASPTTASPASPSPTSPSPKAEPPPPPAPGPVQTADPFGEQIALTPKTVVIVKGSANWDAAFETLLESFKLLSAALDKQGIKSAGNPMIVYTSTDDTGFTYLAEIPVDQEPKNLSKTMSMGKSPDGKALKFVHRGSYDNMDNTYEAITNHLDDKKLEAKDTFIEEYITDPLKTAEDKLVINVYVPLK